ncbi:hypothetical protein IHQ71_28930 (plasmid) [Rhizobium sp. TH2]|uniref:hypothetical protein n=1 Tax=Rhizobium sp. TH2 TaxID=2775403 RepID=UPI0021583B43|nr:hypothetical protein [Rhizobium sp. TH2]UVC12259.1 hypothetical protein IHQ71_28930 [Rhizobium sp. TH2]
MPPTLWDTLDDAVIQVLKGNTTYRVLASYSCHCFTEAVEAHHTPDFMYKHGHETRAFCLVRHALSLNLPNFVQSLLGRSVYLAQKSNFFFIRSNGGNYVVFFALKQAKNPKYDAILNVQSAHLRASFIQYAQPVTFDDLVEAKATGNAIQAGKKQKIQRT